MLNWLARYAAVIDHVVNADGRARTSVPDVGCGPHGLACAVDGVPFVGVDVERVLRRFVDQRRGPASLVLYAPPEVIDGEAALRAAQATFGDTPVPDALDIAILDRALSPGALSGLRAARTVLVA